MSWNDSWRRRRHHPAVRLCAHSHEWIVRWLEENGWRKNALSLPSRKSILEGDPDPGWQQMILVRERDISVEGKIVSVRVPGARTPKARLSVYEWKDLMAELEDAYSQLGLTVPRAHHRLRRT